MSWSDEALMAYADGELGVDERAAIERDLAGDAALRARVAAFRAERQRIAAAYQPVIEEPVPERLAALLRPAPASPTVIELASARQRRAQRAAGASGSGAGSSGWLAWGGMAASLVLGVALGWQAHRSEGPFAERDGRVVAAGRLEQALSQKLAAETGTDAPVRVQLSFVDRNGRYCRTFGADGLAGLACREQGAWAVLQAAPMEPARGGDGMRPAASALPRSLLDAVDQRIAGGVLDAAQERRARDSGWQDR